MAVLASDTTDLRCTVCDASEIVAVKPGTEPDRALDLFVVERGEPMVAWCSAHWPWNGHAATGKEVAQ